MTGPGLRERKKQETRAALAWAAIRLTVERGFDAIKVEDIAEAAGVSPRTFNNYFASKAEALVSRHLDRSLGLADALRQRPAEQPLWTAIGEAVQAQLEPGPEVLAHPQLAHPQWAAGLRAMMTHPVLVGEMLRASAVAEAEIAAAVAERTGTDVRADLYPRLVAGVVMTVWNIAVKHYLSAETPVPIQHLLSDAFAQVAAGLPAP